MTAAQDAQTWVFPAAGAVSAPMSATANFGPIHLTDTLELDWTPATEPVIEMTCLTTFGGKLASYVSSLFAY
jgi:hypothetical protein